jgi:hypothetical protein
MTAHLISSVAADPEKKQSLPAKGVAGPRKQICISFFNIYNEL